MFKILLKGEVPALDREREKAEKHITEHRAITQRDSDSDVYSVIQTPQKNACMIEKVYRRYMHRVSFIASLHLSPTVLDIADCGKWKAMYPLDGSYA